MPRPPLAWPLWGYRLQLLGFLGLVYLGAPQVMAAPLSTGLNWTPGLAPAGETPQSALARIGGAVYRDYGNPFAGDTDRARIRLVRYGATFQTPNAQSGSTWQLGNEINLLEQDNAARTPAQAAQFAQWFKTMRDQLKAHDPQAVIIGPSVWNWDGAGSTCCVTGRDAYAWFVEGHQVHYGTPPRMDYVAVQVYPWHPAAWDDPQTAVPLGLQQVTGAQTWSAGRWPVVVTEWGMLRKPFSCTLNPNQTAHERASYTRGMLDGFANLGVGLALYYGSHPQVCDGNGYMAWLIDPDGSLTPEGQAHRTSYRIVQSGQHRGRQGTP